MLSRPPLETIIFVNFETVWKRSAARAMGAYDLPHCLRISIGTGEECTLLAETLANFMAGQATDA